MTSVERLGAGRRGVSQPATAIYGSSTLRIAPAVVIPCGVWHAESDIGPVGVRVVNLPSAPYERANPDNTSCSLDTDELPVSSVADGSGGERRGR